MNFLYPLGRGSQWQDLELYYSMKMVERHSESKAELIVIGEEPRWPKKYKDFPEFEMIKMRIKRANSSHIVAAHLLNYLENYCDAKTFILMNDDFIPLEQFDPASMRLYFDGTIQQRIEKQGINIGYRSVLENSKFHADDLNFAVHYPMPIRDLDAFKYALRYTLAKNGGASFRNIYGNMVLKYEIAEKVDDVKFYGHSFFDKETFNYKSWISLSDDCLVPQNRNFLTSLFT